MCLFLCFSSRVGVESLNDLAQAQRAFDKKEIKSGQKSLMIIARKSSTNILFELVPGANGATYSKRQNLCKTSDFHQLINLC